MKYSLYEVKALNENGMQVIGRFYTKNEEAAKTDFRAVNGDHAYKIVSVVDVGSLKNL